jgi:hypothetical protein
MKCVCMWTKWALEASHLSSEDAEPPFDLTLRHDRVCHAAACQRFRPLLVISGHLPSQPPLAHLFELLEELLVLNKSETLF